ncbi:MAG: hypothetical protein B7Z36_04955 [Novosphingobium sp. 12-63-9]|nr:MAG: hypothetical protein B7Z36_04955 [Novosphingobium sp. 12-63-9]
MRQPSQAASLIIPSDFDIAKISAMKSGADERARHRLYVKLGGVDKFAVDGAVAIGAGKIRMLISAEG